MLLDPLKSATHFDLSKSEPWVAFRNTLGFALPLAAGVVLGSREAALVAGLGALIVSYSDGADPYLFRARRMFSASAISTLAIVAGALSARHAALSVALSAIWGFAAGLLVVLGATAGNFGIASLTLFVIFSARPVPAAEIAPLGAFALLGGFLQAALALVLWPIRRYVPELRALGRLYAHLSKMAEMLRSPPRSGKTPLGSDQATDAQLALASLAGSQTYEAWRCRALLNQAERIRIRLLSLSRLQRRIEKSAPGGAEAERIREFLEFAAKSLEDTAKTLLSGKTDAPDAEALANANDLIREARAESERSHAGFVRAAAREALAQMEALAGQLRAAQQLARHATPEGSVEFYQEEARRKWGLRFKGSWATLKANLTPESTAFRHAIRLAAGVAFGELISRTTGLERSYWLPMTIAVVLKPDYSTTFSRAVLRVVGTIAGLLLATAIFLLFKPPIGLEISLAAGFAFLLRWLGPANYGVFTLALSGLVVLLLSITGIDPEKIILARALNTALGGAIGLLVYLLWPTREILQLPAALAQMLDSYRNYSRAVLEGCINGNLYASSSLDSIRLSGRVTRSNLNAVVDRINMEPQVTPDQRALLAGIQASGNRFAHAVMAIEASGPPKNLLPGEKQALRSFAECAESTLEAIARTLRTGRMEPWRGVELRSSCEAVALEAGPLPDRNSAIFRELDQMTNSLNSLAEQVRSLQRSGTPKS